MRRFQSVLKHAYHPIENSILKQGIMQIDTVVALRCPVGLNVESDRKYRIGLRNVKSDIQ